LKKKFDDTHIQTDTLISYTICLSSAGCKPATELNMHQHQSW